MSSRSRGDGLLVSAIVGLCLSMACKNDDAGHSRDGGVTNTGGATGSDASPGGNGGSKASTGGAAGHSNGGAAGHDGGTPETDAASSGGRGAQLDGGGAPDADSGAAQIICTASDRTDTDKDGIPDACDDDDDNDGFVDGDDPAPKDATKPGSFYTPEQILANTHVQEALAAAKAAGHEVKTFTQHGAPAISGYYLKPEGEGKVVASGNGDNVGSGLVGDQIRFEVDSTDHVSQADVGFLNGALFGPGGTTATGAMLRGENNEFTIYDRHVVRCPEPDQDSAVYAIGITSAQLYDDGKWLLVRQLAVSVAVTGTVTSDCALEYAGDMETPGGWSEAEAPRYIPTPLSDLNYMCKDANVGYVPTESWARKDGTECKCTLDIVTECSAKDGGG